MQDNKVMIPLAIIVAGVLIGGAVYYKGSATPTTPDGSNPTQDITIQPISPDDHVLGNPNAPIVMIEFSDIDCPFCQAFDVTMRQIMDKYGKDGKVAWVYRNFPLDQLHPNARAKAEAAECVAALAGNDAYWKFLGTLFSRNDETMAELGDIAAASGADKTAVEKCIAAGTYKQNVVDDESAAVAAGGRGTPYTVVIGPDGSKTPLNGALPFDQVDQVIQTLLVDQGGTQ